ncbi:Undecaprenyl pyrophosphate synthetase [Desulfacinum hydrothermale DSM 13146]|uniref:Isoprenyl transferase n=1 Tax=Desulfacinum hydrothermale DSM 13146 TaxID=1121390 RepID=A0A1W1XMR4_9BACT|nr:polyprenyl diphosphate synthase [Desulfacinum hydrothermale]SMC25144.1 Undecaprenyl pyrophosphate synthetase [Desulfacinum hydrothermale DSM 13146]
MDRLDPNRLPRHVAIIMDGNGRWAKKRLLNRVAGHEEGTESVRAVIETARRVGIPYLTLYAFSKENWQRPAHEVQALWRLLHRFIRSERPQLLEKQIRVRHFGDPEGIPEEVYAEFSSLIQETAGFDKLTVNLALNYGGRQEILRAAALFAEDVRSGRRKASELSQEVFQGYLFTADTPELDLLIRTSGECRVSNFLLWQLAYAEIHITETLWPDFREPQFVEALIDYQRRERRFGKISEQVSRG